MEKFAVDLDKVLDELEFNEDRAENLTAAGGKRHITSVSQSIPQDLAASHAQLESGESGSKWRPKPVPLSQKTSVSGVFSSLNEYLNSGRTKSSPSSSYNGLGDLCSTAQPEDLCPVLPVWSPTVSNDMTSEEKPNLIDTNVLHPSTSVIPYETEATEDRQSSQEIFLLDIDTAGTFGNPTASEDPSSSSDFISCKSNMSDVGIVNSGAEDTANVEPPRQNDTLTFNILNVKPEVNASDVVSVNQGTEDNECVEPPSQNNMLTFNALHVNSKISDDDLNDYLSDLELEEQEQEGLLNQVPSRSSSSIDANHESSEMKYSNGFASKSQACILSEAQGIEVVNSDVNSRETADIVKTHHDDVGLQLDSKSGIASTFESEQLQIISNDCSQDTSVETVETERSEGQGDLNLPYHEGKEIVAKISQSVIESPTQAIGVSVGQSSEISKESTQAAEEQNEKPEASISVVSTGQSINSEISLEKESSALISVDVHLSLPPISTLSPHLVSDNNNKSNNALSLYERDNISKEPLDDETGSFSSAIYVKETRTSLDKERNVPLTLSLDQTVEMPSNSSSPATPPTVPVTPTFQDAPVLEEFASALSSSSTPFLTPVAVIESAKFNESVDEAALNLSSTVVSAGEAQTDSVTSDPCQKPVRPCFLEIPVQTEPGQVETTGSSEESPVAFNATVGPPGATPCANKPSIAEALAEPQGTDESAIESSVEEVACGAEGVEEPSTSITGEESLLGKEPPFWVPDADAPCCMQCDFKFTVLKRRHHCRACGKVLCSKCCSEKAHLEYINAEARVCVSCKSILIAAGMGSPVSPERTTLHPNPNNPSEYCSTVPPLLQVAGSSHYQTTPTVMVPVGVLKREGSTKPKSEAKQVMFSDGIRPGADLAELDGSSEPRLSIRRTGRTSKRVGTPPGNAATSQRTLLSLDGTTLSYVPHGKGLPPVVIRAKDGIQFEEDPDPSRLLAVIRDDSAPPVKFTINRNLYVLVKILNLDCCVNRVCWCFTSDGLSSVGQDEIVIILEVEPEETTVPKDIFIHLNTLYTEAAKGNTVTEMGHTLTQGSPFLGSREHGGFLYVRPTFQCLHRLILPPAPYLVGVLIHKWETPWARIFPIRLMLRLGAEFRYYPCPLVSIRQRSAVYGEIGHTIIQVLADFRNMAYTLPTVRGLVIHMEDKQTTILLPRNRYDQVMRALNNSNEHVLAFGSNFSQVADSHLVCMQSDSDHSYHTQAINIHNKPRKVTGASFVVFNGALKVSCGMAAKSTIVEDGLMVKVTCETMASLKTSLRDMKDLSITCGPINPPSVGSNAGAGILPNDEVVLIKWAEDDRSFNIGVLSSVDGRPLDGVPSIRVHNGTDYHGEYRFIRWTEVFILESEEGSGRTGDPVDISRLSEQLAKATCLALVKLLDLLAAANLTTLAVRATIHPENVGYLAGSTGEKLPPIYMNSLDDELVPVLHEAGLMSGESPAVLELVFRIMESG